MIAEVPTTLAVVERSPEGCRHPAIRLRPARIGFQSLVASEEPPRYLFSLQTISQAVSSESHSYCGDLRFPPFRTLLDLDGLVQTTISGNGRVLVEFVAAGCPAQIILTGDRAVLSRNEREVAALRLTMTINADERLITARTRLRSATIKPGGTFRVGESASIPSLQMLGRVSGIEAARYDVTVIDEEARNAIADGLALLWVFSDRGYGWSPRQPCR